MFLSGTCTRRGSMRARACSSATPAELRVPAHLDISGGATSRLPETLRRLHLSRPLLVTDPVMGAQDAFTRLAESLTRGGIEYDVFDQSMPEPTFESCARGLAAMPQDTDCVVGFGGGSSMDTAKAIAAGPISSSADSRRLPVIVVPTAAGSGAEVTQFTVLTDGERGKVMLSGAGLLPAAALVDFELTLSMPYRMTADNGLDSLSHAMEAYVSRAATPATDELALSAMRGIAGALRTVCASPGDRRAREAMMVAGTKAGLAFSNASVTLVHAMSQA